MTISFFISILGGVTMTTGLALTATSLARRSSAAARHALLTAAFGVLLVLPIASAVAPLVAIRVSVPAPSVVSDAMTSIDEGLVTAGPNASALAVPVEQPRAPWLPAWPVLAVAVWIAGVLALAAPLFIGLVEVRSIRRRALPWRRGEALAQTLAHSMGLRRPVAVVAHEAVSGPMTCGLMRPSIVMPADVDGWADADVIAALVHELEHVRRADWLTQCLARTMCACYWFHPLVWIARRQLVLEAERASDDAVLRYREATAYADQLVGLAKRLSSAHQPLLAMANRRDLTTRVRALLDGRQVRGRAGARLVVGVSVAATAAVLAMSPLRVVTVASSIAGAVQGASRWEAVSVRPCDPSGLSPLGRAGGAGLTTSIGRLNLDCLTLEVALQQAYFGRVVSNPDRSPIVGGPGWIKSDRWIVEAKAYDAPAPGDSALKGPMLQALLEDRFKLKTRRETREVPDYELAIAKGGPKLSPLPEGSCTPLSAPPDPAKPRCGRINVGGSGPDVTITAKGVTLAAFAGVLGGGLGPTLDRPVVDRTGLPGLFDISLTYAREGATPDAVTSAPVFGAVRQQLGLTLEPSKVESEILVIESASKPLDGGGAQTSPQRFEAVSIRPCQDDTPPPGANGGQRSSQGGFPTVSPGRFTIDCGTVERMISNAYVLNGEKLENNSPRIGDVAWWKGGPEWIRYDKFTVEASAPGVTDRAVLLGPMLRTLLEERFGLKLHRETQDAPMYAMTIAKGGLKIQPMAPDGCRPPEDQFADAASARANADGVMNGTAKPNCGGMTMLGSPGNAKWSAGGTTIPGFASTLTSWMDRHVIDKTGADAETKYNIHLEFAYDEHVPGPDKRNPPTTFAPADAPSIFVALEQQLGLHLESTKGPQGVLVIDHVDHPKADGGWVVPMRARGPGR